MDNSESSSTSNHSNVTGYFSATAKATVYIWHLIMHITRQELSFVSILTNLHLKYVVLDYKPHPREHGFEIDKWKGKKKAKGKECSNKYVV